MWEVGGTKTCCSLTKKKKKNISTQREKKRSFYASACVCVNQSFIFDETMFSREKPSNFKNLDHSKCLISIKGC